MTNSPTNSIPNTTSRVNHFTGLARRRRKFSLLPANGDGSTLTLDFTTDQLDPRLTFTRASDATFINSSGLVQWADANHVQNSTMLNNTGTRWTQATSGGTVTINGDGTVRFNGTGGRATWLQSVGSLASGLPMTFSFRVTSFTNTNLRTTDLFNAGTGFTGQSYFYTDTTGTTHTLTAFESLPKSGTNGVGTYSVTATTNATSANIIFGSDCNGVGGRSGDVTITEPQLQYGTVVPRRVYVPNSSIIAAKWDSARFDHDPTTLAPRGLLIEGQAVNVALNSDVMRGTGWAVTNLVTPSNAAGVTDPANGTNSTNYIANGTTGYHFSGVVSTTTGASTTAVTWSCWVRANGYTKVLMAEGNSGRGAVSFDIDPNNTTPPAPTVVGGAGSPTGTITRYPNNWYRIAMRVGVASSTAYQWNVIGYPTGATLNNFGAQYTGDSTNGIYVWGAMLEDGSGASSYIPTGASQGTRNADNCELLDLTTMGFNANTGTIYTDVGVRRNTGSQRNYTFLPASGSNNQIFEGSGIALNVYTSGSFVAQIGTSGLSASKIAAAYAPSDYAVSVNGGTVATVTAGTVPTSLTKLTIGGSIVNATAYANGCIRVFKYWPTRLPNAQLQSLTTP
jgi:hypothetical protein